MTAQMKRPAGQRAIPEHSSGQAQVNTSTVPVDGLPMPGLTEAQRLLEAGFDLVKLHPYSKRPIGNEWNKHPAVRIDPDATGYGIPLAANGLCSIDPDQVEMARAGLAAWGFDLEQLLAAGVRTSSTRPGSGGRSAFAADEEEMTRWLTFAVFGEGGNSITVLELRAKSENLQDCVPGVVYADSTGEIRTQCYANGRTFDNAPDLPDDFARLWRLLSTDDDALREYTRKFVEAIAAAGYKINGKRPQYRPPMGGGKTLAFPSKHRGDYNRAGSVESVIEPHSYQWHPREGRWSPPSATGAPGIRPIPGKDGLWQSDHASDPLHGTFDRWAAHVQLDHNGDVEAAEAAFEAKQLEEAMNEFGDAQEAHKETTGNEVEPEPDAGTETPGPTKKPVEPVDLFGNLELPAFPIDLLPRSIADYAKDQAELMGVDSAIVGMSALAVTAACLDDRIKIQPKRHDPTWTESARLWITPVGDPSTMKSPGISKAMAPAFKINAEWRKEADRKWKAYEQAQRRWDKKAAKEDNPGPPPEPPHIKRLVYEDATVEKMGDLMAKHTPRGALVYRDELTGWLSSMDAYKNGGGKDRAAWLEAYNGGTMAIDRVSRGSTFVENWSACILGGIQPSVIHEYAKVTNHDGMLQRFIIVFARSAGEGVDRNPNMDAKHAYESMVERVAAATPCGEVVKLSEDAHEVREALWAKLTQLVRLHPNPYLVAALGKWKGTFTRLLLTFHASDCAERGAHPTGELVKWQTAANVASLMWNCLLPHAVKFYQELDDAEDKARLVARLLLARGWERFTVKRDLDRYLSTSRGWKPWELDETMQRLESFGWLQPIAGKVNERGTPSAYAVNPLAHERFKEVAERERERRAEITQLMGELRG